MPRAFDATDMADDIHRATKRLLEEYDSLKEQLDDVTSERDGALEEVKALEERVAELEKEGEA